MLTEKITFLKEILNSPIFISDKIPNHYFSDWSNYSPCCPLALVKPRNTEEVSKLLTFCNENSIAIVPQGGMTGLAGGATPTENSIALSLELLSGDIEIDSSDATLTAGAGNTLESIQQAAQDKKLRYPIDFGSRGSCQIGGTVATNAGGHSVIRHGMTRNQVLGIEVVLADGTVLDLMNTMIKNNSGYDLKQCFIGSEGTLGIITRVVLKLEPELVETQTLLCALPDYKSTVLLLRYLKSKGITLEAFEVMWNDFYSMSCNWLNASPPLDTSYPLYVLCELEKQEKKLEEALEQSIQEGLIIDAVIATSLSQAQHIWHIREATSEFSIHLDPISFDISLPISNIGDFVNEAKIILYEKWPGCHIVNFGHIGDGNLHLTIDGNTIDKNNIEERVEIEKTIYKLVEKWRGSISAEHGIGVLKKEFLHHSVKDSSIKMMIALKNTLDKKNILNPGKVINST